MICDFYNDDMIKLIADMGESLLVVVADVKGDHDNKNKTRTMQ